jgi:hypothetical protein
LQRATADDCVTGDFFGGFEVSFQTHIIEKLHGADIGKTFAAGGVADEFAVEVEVETSQVFNRVGIFGAGEAAENDVAGITGVCFGRLAQLVANCCY